MGVERGRYIPLYAQQRRHHLTCLLGSVCVMWFCTPTRVAYSCLEKTKGQVMCNPSGGPTGGQLLSFWHCVLREAAASTVTVVGGWWFSSEALKAPYYTHFSFVMSLRERDVTQLFVTSMVGTGSSCVPWWDSDAPNNFLHLPMHGRKDSGLQVFLSFLENLCAPMSSKNAAVGLC